VSRRRMKNVETRKSNSTKAVSTGRRFRPRDGSVRSSPSLGTFRLSSRQSVATFPNSDNPSPNVVSSKSKEPSPPGEVPLVLSAEN